jgi:Zn-dependent protease/predicted transcriptional regulator
MKAHIKLGRIFGIQIGLHYSWLIIALLITLSLATQFRLQNRNWSEGVIIATAIATALLFFASIVLHELSHAAVAKSRGLPVRSITLFALGGVALIEKEASDAKTEFWMGLVGPITSVVIGIVCLALAAAFGWNAATVTPATPLTAMLMWLGVINIVLGVFNLVPGYPLDGGRVLRAIIWWISGNRGRSTRIAAGIGQLVAFAFIAIGIFRFFGGAGIGGLWLAFIGWFLMEASRESYAQSELTEALRGMRVRDVMGKDCPVVDRNTNLQTFVDDYLLHTGRRCFVVAENGRVIGIITPHEVRAVERRKWPLTTVDDVMRSLDQLRTVTPETSLTDALELMGREDVNQLPVVKEGNLTGFISRGHILQLLRTRAELHV